MPIYTLTIQITADIEADSEEAAQQAAIEHLAQVLECSDVIDVDKVTVSDVREVEIDDPYFLTDVEPVSDEEIAYYEQEYLKGPEIEEGDVY